MTEVTNNSKILDFSDVYIRTAGIIENDGNTVVAGAAAQSANVPVVVDALDGANLTGSTLTTSATPTVDELEACVGVLGGKVNAILAVLSAHGLMASS
jgi:hypothetical protein